MKMRYLVCIPLVFHLSGCGSDGNAIFPIFPPDEPQTIRLQTTFNNGAHNWVHGISDLPPGSEDQFDFAAGLTDLPGDQDKRGYRMTSHNQSDDVFMFLKRRIRSLEPDYDYRLTGEFTFLSNAGVGCTGAGGSPGESVYMKVGAHEMEPVQVDYYLNLDIGSQSNSGNDAFMVGNAATEGASCSNPDIFREKTLTLRAADDFIFTTSSDGDAWVFLGSDSGYEGVSTFYYTTIRLTFTPVDP